MAAPDTSPLHLAILAAGAFPEREEVRSRLLHADRILCCDSAAQLLLPYREPDLVTGDLDSLQPQLRERFQSILHPNSDQETNDQTKAFHLCVKTWMQPLLPSQNVFLTLYGATGKREDHTLGNIALLSDYADMLQEAGWNPATTLSMVSDFGSFFPLRDSSLLRVKPGQALSIFSFDPSLVLHNQGLEYPTHLVKWQHWWMATLNRAAQQEIRMVFNHPAPVLIYLPDYFGPSPWIGTI